MKHRKARFALILAFLLLLGTLPAQALEPEVGSLHEQGGGTELHLETGVGRTISNLFTNDDELVTEETFTVELDGISWGWNNPDVENSLWIHTGNAIPGSVYTLTAVRKSDGAVFTIPVAVVLPTHGFYSGPTATNESFLLTADTRNDNVINYLKSGRELYLIDRYGRIQSVTCDSPAVSAELLENRAVKLVLSEEVTEGSRSAALQVEMPGRTQTFSLLFTDGKGLVTRNNKTKWEIEAGGYGWTQLFTMENETVTADRFTLSSQLGAAVRLYTDSVSYNASSLRPGTVDVLTATRIADGETFTMPVEITLPYYGFYSGEEATNESFLCAAGSSLAVPFRYDPEDPQPVYYRSKNAAIMAASIDSPALTASVTASGAVRIALAEGVTRGNELGVLHFSTEYGAGTQSLIFTDGTLMLCGSSTIASSLPRERNELKLNDLDGAPVSREEYPTLRVSGDGLGSAAWEGETPVWSGAAETGTGTLTAVSADGSRSLTLFLECRLPNNGFYDAPERSAAHYLSKGTSYTGQYDEENGRQIYYFGQASASDLSFRSANSGDGRVSAAPYGDGACLAIRLDDSVQEQTVETQIQYSGVNGYGSNWPGTLNVRFVPAVTHRHELE